MWEWNEAIIGGDVRKLRGGSYNYEAALMKASYGHNGSSTYEYDDIGFRIASTTDGIPPIIPEPSTLIIWSLLGGLGIALGWCRRRKPA